MAEHGDDFCHECGHGFAYGGATDLDAAGEGTSEGCPMCPSGEIQDLSYGIRQCDSCGYTVRDWSTA